MNYFIKKPILVMCFLLPILGGVAAADQKTTGKDGITDVLSLGNESSEKAHDFLPGNSQVIKGLLKEPARILLPPEAASWLGGSMFFKLKVDANQQNYITIRLSGDDVSQDNLVLICNGKQVGYRHLGDVEILDLGTDFPFKNGRFYYKTCPLPLSLTKGQQQVQLEIRSTGHIWGYGQAFDKYQHNMEEPTRGIYKLYTHTNPSFTPPSDEKQGSVPKAEIAKNTGKDVLDEIKDRVNLEIRKEVRSAKPLSQVQMQFLAKAYRAKWTEAYRDKATADKILEGLDAQYVAWRTNPKLAEADPATPNPDWFGMGICGQVIYLMKDELGGKFDEEVSFPGFEKKKRQDAYAEFLEVCRDWHARHRRMYSNQSMINDLYGIYYPNKGLQSLGSVKAKPEQDMLRYLYESVGLQPWLGSETDKGPSRSAGDHYMELTAKGLTKELGFVGNYGEVLDWVTEIYEATRPEPGKPGDEKIKAQIEKIALARTYFRFPATDSNGKSAMRMEVVTGWRDVHFPGDITYLQRPSWDGTPLQIATATQNTKLVAYTQQMLEDNQFFSTMKIHIANKTLRVTAGLMPLIEEYEYIKTQPKTKLKLPMTEDQPDFVFSDEEDGVVAVKNGKEYFYASLYWRARNAINYLGRVHLITPVYDLVATQFEEEEFVQSGMMYSRKDWTNFGFANGGLKYPDTTRSAYAGEQLPIADIPAGVTFKPGDESPYAGRASFYKLQYGNYLVGMNNSDKEYQLKVPDAFANALNIGTGKKAGNVKSITITPMSTIVLFKN